MSYKEQAASYYSAHYSGKGIAPKHVAALKEVLAKAFRKGQKPSIAAKAFFEEKGITFKEDKEAPVAAPETPAKEALKEPKPEPEEPTVVVSLPKTEVTKMDRKSMKATIAQLKDAGVDIAYAKSDDDGTLMRKINEAMASLASPKVLEKLKAIDPEKLTSTLKKDCLGLFVDLRSPSCQVCTDNRECVKQYLVNLAGDFSVFKPAMKEIKLEEEAAEVDEETIEAATAAIETAPVKKKSAKVEATTWNAERRVFVMDVENPNDETDDAYTTIQAVLDEVPGTMAEVREIVEREWEYDDDAKFVRDWISGLRKLGIIKFESDLTEDERAALVAAGAL